MDLFIDDFSMYEGTIDLCLEILTRVLHRCYDINSVWNWEKCYFMAKEGLVWVLWFLIGASRLIKLN